MTGVVLSLAKTVFFPKETARVPLALPVQVPDPAVSPDPDDKALKAAKRRKFAIARQRSGRLSTINEAPLGTVLG